KIIKFASKVLQASPDAGSSKCSSPITRLRPHESNQGQEQSQPKTKNQPERRRGRPENSPKEGKVRRIHKEGQGPPGVHGLESRLLPGKLEQAEDVNAHQKRAARHHVGQMKTR